jgi:hypothetical protein
MDDRAQVLNLISCSDNSCEINVLDLFEKKEIKADQLNKADLKDPDTISGKYIGKNRHTTRKIYEKKVAS